MVVSLTYKQVINYITFPVYKMPEEETYFIDGILFCNDLVIDDKNQLGETLGARRIQTPHRVKKLSTTYSEFIDLIKENPKSLIDSKGNIFHYKKTKYQKLKSFKIRKKELKETYTRVWLHRINFCFIVTQPPVGKSWARILMLDDRPWLLYDFSEEKQADERRKI